MTRRAGIPGLRSRYPMGEQLPGMYADDHLAQQFTAGLDDVLAPILSTLDNLAHYFDPVLAPEDFVAWLGTWVATELDPDWPLELRRAVVARAVELHRWKGTARGLAHRLWLCLGVHSRILDGPGATWSIRPGNTLGGEPNSTVRVQVWPGRAAVDHAQVTALVDSVSPIHLTCTVEVLPGPPPREQGQR